MDLSRITSDGKTAGKAAWLVYTFCTVIMGAMAYFSNWSVWITVELLIHLAVLTFLIFYPKSSAKLQAFFMMVFSFVNIFMCSVAERDIYHTLLVFLGAAILLTVYRSDKLLLAYSLLMVGGILFHIFILQTVPFDTSMQIIAFIVRISVLFTAMFILMVIVKGINNNRMKLLQSVRDAKRAEHYKSDFLANMSHEIRTPMNAIIGMCELILREETLSDSARENCFNIQTSGKSLLAIINDILDFSKIESGNMELIKAEFNIASILNDVINMSEARKDNKKIEIVVNIDPNVPKGLLGDEVRISQIIINLMTNAIKFTEKGRVTLTVSRTVHDYGINLMVSVADTGIGITEENIERLFTSFRQVDTKKNRSVEGTGLGLAISKRLIEQMGGFISVKSEYGVGSEFRFVIPLSVTDSRPLVAVNEPDTIHAVAFFGENESAAERGRIFYETGQKLGVDFRHASSVAELQDFCTSQDFTHIFVDGAEYLKDRNFFETAAHNVKVFVIRDRSDDIRLSGDIGCIYKPFYVIPIVSALNNESVVLNLNERRGADIRFTAPKARILIVDDNIINLKVAIGLMQPYNMQIMTAMSGPEAIELLGSKNIDLVFMDHMMPGMDGVEVTEIIRASNDEYYTKLPIIALTANAVNGVREMFISSGFNDFLAKPIELSTLDRILRSYLPKEYLEPPAKVYYGKRDRRRSGNPDRSIMPESDGSPLLDTRTGIFYVGGNEKAYREILSIFAQKSREKIEVIGRLFEQRDAKNYAIEVHALKSSSLSIGAAKLSGIAKELEAAGKAGNIDAVEEKNDELLKLYEEVAGEVRKYLDDVEDSSSVSEEIEIAELTEITADMLREYIDKAKDACRGFDGNAVSEIAGETKAYSYGGEPLIEYFGKAAELTKDFEYEAAEDELTKLEMKIEAKV